MTSSSTTICVPRILPESAVDDQRARRNLQLQHAHRLPVAGADDVQADNVLRGRGCSAAAEAAAAAAAAAGGRQGKEGGEACWL